MKKYWICITLILLILLSTGNKFFKEINIKVKEVTGIDQFVIPKPLESDSYLLVYPSDSRVDQKNTIIKHVSLDGDILEEYHIIDPLFRRINAHQKPTDKETIYFSGFSELVIENWFYVYDVNAKQFKKMEIPYFLHDVGVDHIKHYGEDTLFQTIVSHKTGDQVYNEKTEEFRVSISNFTQQNSYETEWGYVPNGSPLLQLGENIIFSVSQTYFQKEGCIGVLNQTTGNISYIKLGNSARYTTMFSNQDYAYVIGDNLEVYVIDNNLNYKVYHPFQDIYTPDLRYMAQSRGYIMLDEQTAIIQLYEPNSRKYTMGVLTLTDSPKFLPFSEEYLNEDIFYEFVWADHENNELHLIEMKESNAYLLVLDTENFSLKYRIPIEHPQLLDFVIKP